MIDKDAINELIDKRTNYGYHEMTVPKRPRTIMAWSNGSANWYCYRNEATNGKRKGDIILLDANQIIVPYKRTDIKKLVDEDKGKPINERHFHVLPLDKNSAEALYPSSFPMNEDRRNIKY